MSVYISFAILQNMRDSTQQTLFAPSEEGMKEMMWKKHSKDRRYFIGGSDARIIMGDDETAGKNEVRLSQRTSLAISSSSSVLRPV
jgi:predicted phage-related endonuclease